MQSRARGAVRYGLGTKEESAKETKKEQPVIWKKMRKEARRKSQPCQTSHGEGRWTIVGSLAIARAILWFSRGDEWKVETMDPDCHLTLTDIRRGTQ